MERIRTKRRKGLLPKQMKFVQKLAEGKTITEAGKLVGYSTSHASRLANKEQIMQALDSEGLSDRVLAKTLRSTIETGVGVKATNSDAISGLRLAFELKGALKKDNPEHLTQNNVYINELKGLDDVGLQEKLEALTKDI